MKDATVDRAGYRPTKAYYNLGFLKSRDARLVRILSEYLEPASRLQWQRVTDTIVFFGSARACPLKEAEARLAEIKRRIKSTERPGPGLRRELRCAEQRMKLARYYEEAASLAGLIVKWAKTLNGGMKRLVVSIEGTDVFSRCRKYECSLREKNNIVPAYASFRIGASITASKNRSVPLLNLGHHIC